MKRRILSTIILSLFPILTFAQSKTLTTNGVQTVTGTKTFNSGKLVAIAPSLGTPTAINLANALGLTASQVNSALGGGGAVLADGSVAFTGALQILAPVDNFSSFVIRDSTNTGPFLNAYPVIGGGSEGMYFDFYSDSPAVESVATQVGINAKNVNIKTGPTGVDHFTAFFNEDGSSSFGGHLTVEGVTSTGATGTGKFVFDTSPSIAKLANLTTNGHVSTSGGDGTLVSSATIPATDLTGTINVARLPTSVVPIRCVTGSLSGALTLGGAPNTGTCTATGATNGMVATCSPTTYPGNLVTWKCYVSAANTVTVVEEGLGVVTPTATTFQVSVTP